MLGDAGPLRAHMGLHTGEADERGGDYFGPPVNRVARLEAAGHGGQLRMDAAAPIVTRMIWARDAYLVPRGAGCVLRAAGVDHGSAARGPRRPSKPTRNMTGR